MAVKLDLRNAFNSVRRDRIMEVCVERAPEISQLVSSRTGKTPHLSLGIKSSVLEQESNKAPLGPLLFALAIDEAVRSILSPFNLWYLDDATIGGSVESITEDLSRLIPSLRNLGLNVNVDKSEILNLNYPEADFPNVNMTIQGFIAGAQTIQPSEATFLGCPLTPSGLKAHLAKKDSEFRNPPHSSLLELDSHIAFFLMKNSIHMPKLLYTLRCLPCYSHPDTLTHLEKSLKSCTEAVLNISFDEIGWTQAKLPVRFGGIGLRSPKDLAPHAHFSSISRNRQLVREVLLPFNELSLVADCRPSGILD
ncbi:uncharacterized protein LOC115230797 [Octopus sinensis]|uniref:Uncharacterized protein LOC115230797 n=1 Tax=Octopus sinensis TaxID=2607531 RepID=A0A6P7U3E0_9MOLL|nr:uncharacterized protein LOC115230797 [Octopus sinensis]